jgi:hypothetical protein
MHLMMAVMAFTTTACIEVTVVEPSTPTTAATSDTSADPTTSTTVAPPVTTIAIATTTTTLDLGPSVTVLREFASSLPDVTTWVEVMTDVQITEQLRAVCSQADDPELGVERVFIEATDLENFNPDSQDDIANMLVWMTAINQAVIELCPEYGPDWRTVTSQLADGLAELAP